MIGVKNELFTIPHPNLFVPLNAGVGTDDWVEKKLENKSNDTLVFGFATLECAPDVYYTTTIECEYDIEFLPVTGKRWRASGFQGEVDGTWDLSSYNILFRNMKYPWIRTLETGSRKGSCTFKYVDASTDTGTHRYGLGVRFDYCTGTVRFRHIKVEKGVWSEYTSPVSGGAIAKFLIALPRGRYSAERRVAA